jgi:plasmid stability protein
MRTTLDLPDELATEIKIMAAQERLTLKELIRELLRNGLKARQMPSRPTTLPPAFRSPVRLNRSWLSGARREGRR